MKRVLVAMMAWAGVAGADCPKLEPIAKLYDTYAAELAASPLPNGVSELSLVAIAGKPMRVVDADYVAIGPLGATIYAPDGSAVQSDVPDWDRRGAHLVIAPGPTATYEQVTRAVEHGATLGYTDIAIAYGAFGALHGRSAVETPEANRKKLNVPAWGLAFEKELAAHCPVLEAVVARDPMSRETIISAAPLIRQCSCELDARYLQQWPVLVGEPLLTLVPLGALGDLAKVSPRSTWQGLVTAAGGRPVALLPLNGQVRPPPPPPPRR